jgi:very-short-patch-repair endonuclease
LALESALRARLVTVEELIREERRSAPTSRGRGTLRALLEGRSPILTESTLEALVLSALLKSGLPAPSLQHEIFDQDGVLIARVDFAYPDARLAIEADGYRFHSTRNDWSRDRARQNALIRLGWTPYRVTWEDVRTRSGAMVEDIARLLASRSARGV